jgi:hypothetical protein
VFVSARNADPAGTSPCRVSRSSSISLLASPHLRRIIDDARRVPELSITGEQCQSIRETGSHFLIDKLRELIVADGRAIRSPGAEIQLRPVPWDGKSEQLSPSE